MAAGCELERVGGAGRTGADAPEPRRIGGLELIDRIATARDAEVLWYARAELFADLCRWHDEPQAISALASLRPLFRGSLPASLLKSRAPGDNAPRTRKR